MSRTADPWGARTPYGRGEPWPERVDSNVEGEGVESLGGVGLGAALQRRRAGHRRRGRPDRRRARARGRPGQPRPARSQGPVRLAGQPLRRPAHRGRWSATATGSSRRLGHGDGPHRRALAGAAATSRAAGAASASTRAASCSSRSTTRSRVIGKAGIGTPHMDGNTRLCTATAAAALKARFGTDGQPGSYTDVDHCDAIALCGHNVAETQTVLWMRMLDRRRGADPPRMLARRPAADAGGARGRRPPRRRATARTWRCMNGLLRELHRSAAGTTTTTCDAHTLGFERARARGRRATRRRAARRSATSPPRDRRAPPSCVGTRRARCCRRCCRASTSRTRRPPRRAR